MRQPITVYTDPSELAEAIGPFLTATAATDADRPVGICGFDGFIDTFIRVEQPSTMAEFGTKVHAAAGISASYTARHEGDKFGGNGPLLANGLHGLYAGEIDLTYIGALGKDAVLPIFEEALAGKMKALYTLAEPAHSDCLEFSDGKIMLSDLRSCAEVTWERMLECVGRDQLDALLTESAFIAAVNWGKLVAVGPLWENLAARLATLGIPPKQVHFFMDLAEFEQRPETDCRELVERVGRITEQCHTLLSFNLKEAWQMGQLCGLDFTGQKAPEAVAQLAAGLRESIRADRIIIHPNDGAACASAKGAVYLPGPFCREPLISTGAGDHFGAGCLAGALRGGSDLEILLTGVCTSGYFVRSGRSPSLAEIRQLAQQWIAGTLPERL